MWMRQAAVQFMDCLKSEQCANKNMHSVRRSQLMAHVDCLVRWTLAACEDYVLGALVLGSSAAFSCGDVARLCAGYSKEKQVNSF